MELSSGVQELQGSESYYQAAYEIVKESEYFVVAAKTPTLLLPQEKQSEWREKYFDLAFKRIAGGLPTTYLFSYPETVGKLREITDESTLRETLESWKFFVRLKEFVLEYVQDSNFQSVVYGDRHLALSRKDAITGKSIGAIVYPTNQATKLIETFKEVEKRSMKIDNKTLEQFWKQVSFKT